MSKQDFKITSPAVASVVTANELDQHLNLFGDHSYDGELDQLLLTAQEYVGKHIGKFVAPTSVEVTADKFDDIELPHAEARSITVKYYDSANVLQTLPSTDYLIDPTSTYPTISFKNRPSVSIDYKKPIVIQYVTGMSDVPNVIRHAILMTAAELFEVRTESTEAKARLASLTIARLLAADKRVEV